ncbi:MAG TPA: S41 family peptidase [Candidatus Paceibacterota bacterium]|nr:S41 family peptidase [Candidatus Paceibacterota bacterium]
MHLDTTKIKHTIFSILVALGLFAFGLYVGSANGAEVGVSGLGRGAAVANGSDLAAFWKVWNALLEKHPDAEKMTEQEMVYGAISGLVDSFDDPYSTFFEPEEAKMFEEDISGNFSGVGMEVGMKDKILTVIAPLKDTPAFRAGIRSGDKILKIDETESTNLSLDQAIKLIRGEKGTEVTLSIFREEFESPKEFKVVRDIINVPVIDTEMRGDRIFVIRLYSFTGNSTRMFKDALQQFRDSKSDKLLIDLRGNPGGYLDASVEMASWFLPSGKTIVIEDYGVESKQKIYRSHGYNVFSDKLKLVILIDGGSASASEILAGALQDHKKALLVGTQSFGKGSVQEVVKISNGTLLKVTVAKWLTPNGNSISQVGLKPDHEVTISSADLERKNDPQLEKAINLLNTWPGIE